MCCFIDDRKIDRKMKQTLKIIVMGFFSGMFGAYIFTHHVEPQQEISGSAFANVVDSSRDVYFSDFIPEAELHSGSVSRIPIDVDFVEASRKSASSVVYIKTISRNQYSNSWFDWFFGDRGSQSISSGSGVIYTKDGYIITNNHVIANSDNIEVIFNKRTYAAKRVGSDPSTDIAVLKIDAPNLPAISIGSSTRLQVGEWVLAVGNPFNLTSTVTAGIVSAKGREINILKSDFPIESFIQTDAAINPGNSGGALVNKHGELVGINTAILSRTGSYAGYGFAVPVDIVKKVVDDMIKYGEVQKAFMGADIIDLNSEVARQINVDELYGVVVANVQKGGAAEKAGLQKGDVILKLNRENVNSRSEFEEIISYHSPGSRILVTYKRDKKIFDKQITLTNRFGSTHFIKRDIYASQDLGADIENLLHEELEMLGIENGVRVERVKDGLIRRLGIQEGFIITHINRNPVQDARQLENNLMNIRGRVTIEGINRRGSRGYYTFVF
jgi:serine protease Do